MATSAIRIGEAAQGSGTGRMAGSESRENTAIGKQVATISGPLPGLPAREGDEDHPRDDDASEKDDASAVIAPGLGELRSFSQPDGRGSGRARDDFGKLGQRALHPFAFLVKPITDFE
jgi:hypothetical protein